MNGKDMRLRHIINPLTKKTVIVPMDHGVSVGPIQGISDMRHAVRQVAAGGANAVVIHKGIASHSLSCSEDSMGLIVHLSCSTSFSRDPNMKTLVCTVQEAIKLGADAVSVHVNVGNENESKMLNDLAATAQTASEWGLPLMAMIYARGERIVDEFDPKAISHAARLGAELGADIVKVPYTGSPETFREVVEGCQVPIVIAGGPRMSNDLEVLEMVHGAMESGAAGTSIGRNVFQHHDPQRIVAAMGLIVHNGLDVDVAMEFLEVPARRVA